MHDLTHGNDALRSECAACSASTKAAQHRTIKEHVREDWT